MYSGVNYTTMGHTASCATATLPSSSYPVANMPKVGSASTTLGQGSAPALGANAGPDTYRHPCPPSSPHPRRNNGRTYVCLEGAGHSSLVLTHTHTCRPALRPCPLITHPMPSEGGSAAEQRRVQRQRRGRHIWPLRCGLCQCEQAGGGAVLKWPSAMAMRA